MGPVGGLGAPWHTFDGITGLQLFLFFCLLGMRPAVGFSVGFCLPAVCGGAKAATGPPDRTRTSETTLQHKPLLFVSSLSQASFIVTASWLTRGPVLSPVQRTGG